MTTTTHLAVQHAGKKATDAGPWVVVEVTRTVEHLAVFPTKRAAEKWLESRERQGVML